MKHKHQRESEGKARLIGQPHLKEHKTMNSKKKRERVSEGKLRLIGPPHLIADHKTVATQSMQEDAKIVVGLDFGTTFSGFSFALMSEPEKVFMFYEWPCQAAAGAKPYCKTQTSLWYLKKPGDVGWELQDWGWPAKVNYRKAVQARSTFLSAQVKSTKTGSTSAGQPSICPPVGHFLTKFKLHLAAAGSNYSPQPGNEILPEGLSAERLISDYLMQISLFIMAELQNKFGRHIVKKDVQWCLTVPAIWDDGAKQMMLKCSQMAGLVQGRHCTDKDAGVHPIVIVLEPEAASVYCQQKLKESQFRKGSKFLVVDAGGGTVDLVVHEKVDDSGLRVKEVARSIGDLCGGTFVDKAFFKCLAGKIGCLRKFSEDYPATSLTLIGYWEDLKCSYNGQSDPFDLDLPAKLASAWEAHEKANGIFHEDSQYDAVTITGDDMKMIFDGLVNKILNLIKVQLELAAGVEAIMVVGGFSNSPYLMKMIRETFSSAVKHIISPPNPGSAVCQGAVAFGALGADIMMSRKSRKTYGISSARAFQKGDPPDSLIINDSGKALCKNAFHVFTRIGEDIPVNYHVTHEFCPISWKTATKITFTMYSTTDPQPEYITDIGVVLVSSGWSYPLPPEALQMDEKPFVEVTMYFGRTLVEVFAEPKNFFGEKISMFSVPFERDLL